MCSYGEQQRTGPGNNYALTLYVETALHEGLQASGTADAGQSPAGKRKEQLARSCGEHQKGIPDIRAALRLFDAQNSRSRGRDRTVSEAGVDLRMLDATKPFCRVASTLS